MSFVTSSAYQAATAAGQAWVWRWNDAKKDWSENPTALGPNTGNQVVLNDDGTLLATTTFTEQVIVYRFVCANQFNCGWQNQAVFDGNYVALAGDDKTLAIVGFGRCG